MGNPGEWEHGNSAVNGGLWMLRTEFRDMKAVAVAVVKWILFGILFCCYVLFRIIVVDVGIP